MINRNKQQNIGVVKNKMSNHDHLPNCTLPQCGHLIASAFISSLQAVHCFVLVSIRGLLSKIAHIIPQIDRGLLCQ